MLKVRRSVLDRLHLAEALPPNSSVVGPEDERSSEIEELRSRNRELLCAARDLADRSQDLGA